MNKNHRGQMRPQNRSTPPLVLIALCVIVTILAFNYWNLSTENSRLSVELDVLRSRSTREEREKNSIVQDNKQNQQLLSRCKEAEGKRRDNEIRVKDLQKQISERDTQINALSTQVNTHNKLNEESENVANELKETKKKLSDTESQFNQLQATYKKDIIKYQQQEAGSPKITCPSSVTCPSCAPPPVAVAGSVPQSPANTASIKKCQPLLNSLRSEMTAGIERKLKRGLIQQKNVILRTISDSLGEGALQTLSRFGYSLENITQQAKHKAGQRKNTQGGMQEVSSARDERGINLKVHNQGGGGKLNKIKEALENQAVKQLGSNQPSPIRESIKDTMQAQVLNQGNIRGDKGPSMQQQKKFPGSEGLGRAKIRDANTVISSTMPSPPRLSKLGNSIEKVVNDVKKLAKAVKEVNENVSVPAVAGAVSPTAGTNKAKAAAASTSESNDKQNITDQLSNSEVKLIKNASKFPSPTTQSVQAESISAYLQHKLSALKEAAGGGQNDDLKHPLDGEETPPPGANLKNEVPGQHVEVPHRQAGGYENQQQANQIPGPNPVGAASHNTGDQGGDDSGAIGLNPHYESLHKQQMDNQLTDTNNQLTKKKSIASDPIKHQLQKNMADKTNNVPESKDAVAGPNEADIAKSDTKNNELPEVLIHKNEPKAGVDTFKYPNKAKDTKDTNDKLPVMSKLDNEIKKAEKTADKEDDKDNNAAEQDDLVELKKSHDKPLPADVLNAIKYNDPHKAAAGGVAAGGAAAGETGDKPVDLSNNNNVAAAAAGADTEKTKLERQQDAFQKEMSAAGGAMDMERINNKKNVGLGGSVEDMLSPGEAGKELDNENDDHHPAYDRFRARDRRREVHQKNQGEKESAGAAGNNQ